MSEKKVKFAVVGVRGLGNSHVIAIRKTPEAELVACCDVKKELADSAAQKYGINSYTSYTEMLEKESLDAVHICLPHYLHTKVARDCFGYGVHVLCEKPMDISVEAAELAIAAAKERGGAIAFERGKACDKGGEKQRSKSEWRHPSVGIGQTITNECRTK